MAQSEIKVNLAGILRERKKKAADKHAQAEKLSQMKEKSLEKLDLICDEFAGLALEEQKMVCSRESADCLKNLPAKKEMLRLSFEQAIREVKILETRFSRPTVNLVVVGAMGAGKSKFLQSASGLSDNEIPSYSGGSCTGVTSIIENSNGETEAVFTFKTPQEAVAEMDREIRNFAKRLHAEDKMSVAAEFSEGVQNLKTLTAILNQKNQKIMGPTGQEQAITEADKMDLENLRKLYETHRQEWEPYLEGVGMGNPDTDLSLEENDGVRQYVLKQKSKIEEYVSKHNKEGTKNYYKYAAVKKAVIRTKFADSIDADIRLIDTVGIGDPAVDTEKRMLEAIQDEADGVIFILEGTDRYENHVMLKDQVLIEKFQEIYNLYRNKEGGEQKETKYWMAFLVNSRYKEGAAEDYGQRYLDAAIIPSFDGKGKVFENDGIKFRKAINVGKPEQVEKALSEFLKQISDHLGEIDAGLESAASKAADYAIAQSRALMEELDKVHINFISNSKRNYMGQLRKERINCLKEKLGKYAEEIRKGTAAETKETFLQQSLDKVRLLQEGKTLAGFPFESGQDASLDGMIAYYNSHNSYQNDFTGARIAVFQSLQSIVREIGSRPLDRQQEAGKKFKKKIAELFVDSLKLDCLKLGDGLLKALDTGDAQFFGKVSAKLLEGLADTEDIQKAFRSLDQFSLDDSNGITKALFRYYAAECLKDTPYEESDVYAASEFTEEELLKQELKQKLEQFISAINEKTQEEAYLVEEKDQLYGELVNFIHVLNPPYDAVWQNIFESMDEQKILQGDEKQRERLKAVADIAQNMDTLLQGIRQ